MWLNHFIEFEKSPKRENRLVLGFQELETGKRVRILVPQTLRIPTGFMRRDTSETITKTVKKDEELSQYPFQTNRVRGYDISTIELPYFRQLVKRLPKKFQIRNYEKILRFNGFFPERKAVFSERLQALAQKKRRSTIELEDLGEVEFQGFLTEQEFLELPSVVVDIEKNLWKNKEEKALLKEREDLLKVEQTYQRLKQKPILEPKQQSQLDELKKTRRSRLRRVSKIEGTLTIEVEDVGTIPLYDSRYDSKIASVTTIWRDGKGSKKKRVDFVDPNQDCHHKTWKGFYLTNHLLERPLLTNVRKKYYGFFPLVSWGQNEVYDNIQMRLAADERQVMFDVAVPNLRVRRDFVRMFMQRHKESMIFMDTMNIGDTLAPHLKQRSFGTSLKLEQICKHFGVDFTKSQSHTDLRPLKLRHLAGISHEVRQQAIADDLDYAVADVIATDELADIQARIFVPLMIRLKQAAPYITYTEFSFSPRCMSKVHEYNHFQECGNLPYTGYDQKERQNQVQIFKKRFKSFKGKRLRDTSGLRRQKGIHQNVDEYYFSLEEGMRDWGFSILPDLEDIYNWAHQQSQQSREGRMQYMAFLQYLREFLKDPFVDYHEAKRQGIVYKFASQHIQNQGISESRLKRRFGEMHQRVDSDLFYRLKRSFRFLKNHFRSIYVALEGEKRKLIRDSKKRLSEVDFPDIARKDADLYLLRDASEQIREELSEGNQSVLKGFNSNFTTFDKRASEIMQQMGTWGITLPRVHSFEILYAYLYNDSAHSHDYRFGKKYPGYSVKIVNSMIKQLYTELPAKIAELGEFVDARGDYIFIQGGQDRPVLDHGLLHHVRHLDEYEVK